MSSSSNSNSKVKVLFAGRIDSAETAVVLVQKLQALHRSKAGPFDVAFATCGGTSSAEAMQKLQSSELPLPLYLQDSMATQGVKQDTTTAIAAAAGNDKDEDTEKGDESAAPSSSCWQVASNLYILRDNKIPSNSHAQSITEDPQAGIWSIPISSSKPNLVVASLPPKFRIDSHPKLQETLQHVSYTGCDILFSTEWPQGIETILSSTTTEEDPLSQNNNDKVSFDVADVALKARARYHVAWKTDIFQQSPAFQHVKATTSTVTNVHTGRFLALCPVTAEKPIDKTRKFVHAVGLVPLHSQGAVVTTTEANAGALPCPYTDAVYPVDDPRRRRPGGGGTTATTATGGLSEAAARRILNEDRHGAGQMSGTDRWANNTTNKRPRQQTHQEQEVDPTNRTLFVYGLHLDVTGRLQNASETGDGILLQAFAPYGADRVRRPPGATSGHSSSFCFVEFPTHDRAAACLEQTAGAVTVQGVHLTLKWATHNTANNHAANHPKAGDGPSGKKRQRLMEADARDSSTVYFKLVLSSGNEKATLPSLTEAGELLRKFMEHTLERALAGGEGDTKGEGDVVVVKAAEEPALQVQVRVPSDTEKKTFGFLDFASHAAASMALATLTGSTDGGRVLEEQQTAMEKAGKDDDSGKDDSTDVALGPHVGIYLHWAQARVESAAERRERDMVEDGSAGFRFERKHFPADARTDCWFCLASESCEKHLITGVYNQCYAAMPKGPVHPGHVLLVPVQHSSQGALKDAAVASEIEELKSKLRKHVSSAFDCDLFVFERAIQTKGGYHTHVQCIPVERNLGLKLQATMLAQARKLNMDLREINSDVGLRAILSSSDDDDDAGGYFYAEVPVGGSECKRFLYKATATSTTSSVPLQFGREVLAAVLGKPELAHWKSCVVDQDQEASIATDFRESFAKASGDE